MYDRQQPKQHSLPTMDALRERMPNLHPYTALVLTLEPMVLRGEITSEEYLRWAAALFNSQQRSLFSEN